MSWPRILVDLVEVGRDLLRGVSCHVRRAIALLMYWSSIPWLPSSRNVLATKLFTEK
jgi:hypothetical protein